MRPRMGLVLVMGRSSLESLVIRAGTTDKAHDVHFPMQKRLKTRSSKSSV